MGKLTEDLVIKTIDWAYNKAINGGGGIESAIAMGNEYLKKHHSAESAAKALIKTHVAQAGASGFVTGLGGIMTLPIAIPANFASVIYVQIRMISAIAHIGGYDVKDNKVKALVLACLVGNVAKDVVQEMGIALGTRITQKLIAGYSEKQLMQVERKISFRIFRKATTQGVAKTSKLVPLVGGVIGGAFDVAATSAIAKIAKKMFLADEKIVVL